MEIDPGVTYAVRVIRLARRARRVLAPVAAAALFLSPLVVATGVRASVDIEVVYGRGRNQTAIKLWTEAEEALKKGDAASAHRSIDVALRSDPGLYPALYTRAKVFIREGKYALAVQDCTNALRQDPTFVEAALLRADANAALGRYDASLKEIEHVVSIRPRIDGMARALSQRAWFRATCPVASYRNGRQAIKDATQACKLMQWKDEDTIDTLAAAYAEIGDFDSAIRYEEQALGMKGITPVSEKSFRAHLDSFKRHRPIRISG